MLAIKTILCPTDFSEPSREAMKIAVEFASHFGAKLCLVHVVPLIPIVLSDPNYVLKVPDYERLLHTDAEEKLSRLTGEMTADGATVRTIVGHGDAAGEIVRIGEQQNVDMIVIATHGMTGWRRVVFGSVAERVVRLAKCLVLTTRAKQSEA